jgi:Ca2+-binding EF-hand superfamily protein
VAELWEEGGILPFLPEDLKAELKSTEFKHECMAAFTHLDVDGSGVLEPIELIPVVLVAAEARNYTMTEDHARQFVEIFDIKQNGVITKAEFVNLARFMLVMSFFETADGAISKQNFRDVQESKVIEDYLEMMEKDRKAIHKIISLLPAPVYDYLTSDEFVQRCSDRFHELDQDKTGVLRPHELAPLVVELTSTSPLAISDEQCARFTQIFDIYGDGVLRPDEFLDFARFLTIMAYLQSDDGVAEAQKAKRVLEDSKKIEQLLEMLHNDRRVIQDVLPHLPDWLQEELMSYEFSTRCMDHFKTLDADGNGTLEPDELYPLVLQMAEAQELALDKEQAKRFTAIFDDAGDGVIRKTEFVNFCRFQIIMGFLNSQDGKKTLEEAERAKTATPQKQTLTRQSGATSRQGGERPPSRQAERPVNPVATSRAAQSQSPMQSPGRADPEVDHMAVDVDFYQRKSEKLNKENEQLRNRMQSIEELYRKMESKLEEQDMRLRHAEVDLQGTARLR